VEEKYAIGDWGESTFIAKKGWKAPTVCHGTITGIEPKVISFEDNDGNEYIIPRSKFQFTKKEFVDKSTI
jgi:hypothetical protein